MTIGKDKPCISVRHSISSNKLLMSKMAPFSTKIPLKKNTNRKVYGRRLKNQLASSVVLGASEGDEIIGSMRLNFPEML